MDVAPRGSLSSASVTSLASFEGLSSKRLMMRCQSEAVLFKICDTQCTSSTYGLPRSLQNVVAPSMALNANELSLPKRVVREISLMQRLPYARRNVRRG